MESVRWVCTKNMVKGRVYRVGLDTTDFIFGGLEGNTYILANYKGKLHRLVYRKSIVEVTNTKEETMKKLYEIKTISDTIYGEKLAVDSSGNWVMELKGTGSVKSFPKTQITEVVPYSVSVKFHNTSTHYEYFAVKGDWTIGDCLLTDNGTFATVTKIDTKSTAANKWLTGFKFAGTRIEAGE